MKVTDLITSAKHFTPPDENYMGFDIGKNQPEYVWKGRINHHTPEEIAEGKRINPDVQVVPVEELLSAMGKEIRDKDRGKVAVFWLVKGNGLSITSLFYKFIAIPAYTGSVEGNYIDVEIDDHD